MKTLVTHINPHLDDICAIWLFRKFHPEYKNADLEFISASRDAAKDESEERIFFGTGGGKYDEHKEGSSECAASLVWNEIKVEGLVSDDIEKEALDELVYWNKLIDTGAAPKYEFESFSVQAYIRPLDSSDESSKKAVELGSEILGRILEVLKRKQHALRDWEKRVEFESKFGKSFALKSDFVDRAFCQQKGEGLYLMVSPKYGSVQYFSPSKDVDLEPIFRKLKEIDSDASWFLHQSHHMVICGSGSAPDFKKTKLSFEELINLAKEV